MPVTYILKIYYLYISIEFVYVNGGGTKATGMSALGMSLFLALFLLLTGFVQHGIHFGRITQNGDDGVQDDSLRIGGCHENAHLFEILDHDGLHMAQVEWPTFRDFCDLCFGKAESHESGDGERFGEKGHDISPFMPIFHWGPGGSGRGHTTVPPSSTRRTSPIRPSSGLIAGMSGMSAASTLPTTTLPNKTDINRFFNI